MKRTLSIIAICVGAFVVLDAVAAGIMALAVAPAGYEAPIWYNGVIAAVGAVPLLLGLVGVTRNPAVKRTDW